MTLHEVDSAQFPAVDQVLERPCGAQPPSVVRHLKQDVGALRRLDAAPGIGSGEGERLLAHDRHAEFGQIHHDPGMRGVRCRHEDSITAERHEVAQVGDGPDAVLLCKRHPSMRCARVASNQFDIVQGGERRGQPIGPVADSDETEAYRHVSVR